MIALSEAQSSLLPANVNYLSLKLGAIREPFKENACSKLDAFYFLFLFFTVFHSQPATMKKGDGCGVEKRTLKELKLEKSIGSKIENKNVCA